MSVLEVVDLRFPGGTMSAVRQEVIALSKSLDVTVQHLNTRMFRGREFNQKTADIQASAPVRFEPSETLAAETVILHNPSALKFGMETDFRIICDRLIVVTHENFLLPDVHGRSIEAFDVAGCLKMIQDRSWASEAYFAPVSDYNRKTVTRWLAEFDRASAFENFKVVDVDWFNIFDDAVLEVQETYGDRRGRMSRPGFEKFPQPGVLDLLFSEKAESNLFLGMEHLKDHRPHWQVYGFNKLPLEQFFQDSDIFVYWVSPNWMESFGRVICEAVINAKIVIAEPRFANIFGDHLFYCSPEDIDDAIDEILSNPHRLKEQVRYSQSLIGNLSSEKFVERFRPLISGGDA